MPTRLVIAAFTFLHVSAFYINDAISQQVTPDDTARVNKLMSKARDLHHSEPDSAICYYRLIHNNPILNEININDDLTGLELAYLETIIRALNYTGNIYYYDDQYGRSEYYYKRSLEMARSAGLENFVARALFDLGYVNYVSNEYRKAKKLFNESYDHYHNTGNEQGMFDALQASGLNYRRLGNFNAADSSYIHALALATEFNDSTLISDVKINRGILLCEQGMLEEGITLFEEALDYYEKTGMDRAVSIALLNIGVVMKMVDEYDKALSYMQKSTEIEESKQHKSQLVVRYYNLADLYLEMGENSKAYEYCQKIRTVANEIGTRPFVAECNYLLGKYYFMEEDPGRAERHLAIASDSAERMNNKPLLTNIRLLLAKTHLQKKDYDKAISLAGSAYSLGSEMHMVPSLKEASLVLCEAFEKSGNPSEALKWHKAYLGHSDSINHFNQQKEINRIEAQYNYEKKERENALLRNEASLREQKLRNRTIATIALVVAIALSVTIILLLMRRNRDAKLLYKQQQMLNLQKLKEIENELDGKKRELASKMMFLNQKNELISRIIKELQEIQDEPGNSVEQLNEVLSELKIESPQSNWKEFEAQFNQVHPDFYKRLYAKHPDLSSYEQRICAFLRMNLNTKEISAITGRSMKSIEVTRSRIRKKLNLSRNDNLNSFLASV